MNQKVIIESLSMDLLRVALALHRGSVVAAYKFKEESLKRMKELEEIKPKGYLGKLTKEAKKVLLATKDRTKDDALMYSTLFRNYARKIQS